MGASAVRSRRRTSTGWRRTGCGSTTCTRRRCARRVGRASSPAAITTATRWRASRSWPPVIPGYNGNVPFENGYISEMLLAHGYNTYMVGKWHLIPSSQENGRGAVRPVATGHGFERFYGFLGGDTSQVESRSRLRQPPGRAAHDTGGGLSPSRSDLVDKASQFVADAKQIDPGQAVLHVLRPGRPTRRTMCRRSGPTSTPGSSTTVRTAYPQEDLAKQQELGSCRRDGVVAPRPVTSRSGSRF